MSKLVYYGMVPTIDGTRYTVRNPFALLKDSGVIELTDGARLHFDRESKKKMIEVIAFALTEGVRFGSSAGKWKILADNIIETPQGLKFYLESFDSTIFGETFLYDAHFVEFDLRDKTVIEAGAFVGDTALYYASKGATVYSFEPDAWSYELAVRNIALNAKSSSQITLRNYAIGHDGEMDFPVGLNGTGVPSTTDLRRGPGRVRSVSVASILKEFNIDEPYLLHLDIKGEEFKVVREPVVSKFKRVRIEYSPYLRAETDVRRRDLDVLLRRLRDSGFEHIRIFKHNDGRYDLSRHGTIDARKE